MNKYEQVKQKIVEAVPEIMELKFECELEIENEPKDWAKRVVFMGGNPDNGLYYFRELDGSIFYTRGLQKEYKIIGRPITLEDVLRAFNKNKVFLAVDHGGAFRWAVDGDRFDNGEVMPSWILGKPLSDQSKLTIDFLDKIL